MEPPRVLILGHSFIRRLRQFVEEHSSEFKLDFRITEPAVVRWHGVGGRTVAKCKRLDLHVVCAFKPDVVFLQLGTNDLTCRGMTALTVGSEIDDFVRLLHEEHGVKLICVGQTLRRSYSEKFNREVGLLAKYLKTVLEPLPYVIYWPHRGFWNPRRPILFCDGVHLNNEGQHKLYRSIRGAVLKCLHSIRDR